MMEDKINPGNEVCFADVLMIDYIEEKLCELYSKEFNIDNLEEQIRTVSKFTPEEQIERYAKNVAFWMNLLKQHKIEVKTSGEYDKIDQMKMYMILDKISCIKQRAETMLGSDEEVYEKYKDRVEELLE